MGRKRTMRKVDRGVTLPQSIQRQIAPNVVITSTEQTKYGLKLEGHNPYQDFVEYFTPDGKFVGGILRNKGENFWSVWEGREGRHIVVTVPMKKLGHSIIVGNKNKSVALRRLHEWLRKGR